jgi:hypothetical protein
VLPSSYAVPAAVVFIIGGVLSCFAGYRLFRLVLGINGFILGALWASSMMGPHNNAFVLALAALVGGLVGSIVLVAGYFMGVALLGAGLGVLALNVCAKPFGGDPHWAIVVGGALVGALVALSVTRYVIIVGTAFGGAWTLLYGAFAIADDRVISLGKVWAVYPLSPAPGRWWVVFAWFALGLVGTFAQLAFTGKKKR